MGRIGKISTIKRERTNTGVQSMESSLASYKNGLTRVPGTGVFKYPYKELSGMYRTGLDPNAAYIKRILDPTERELEIKRINDTLKRLEQVFVGIDLGPHSKFWNYSLSTSTDDVAHVQPVKLIDGDNFFDLNNPFQELAFSWLRVHPTIASSYQAWERGDYPADTQFYVADEEVENAILFKKKQEINKAISKLDSMTPERRKKVARMLGLPISDESKEEQVYNLIDTELKRGDFKSGKYTGLSTIEVFSRFADMKDELLNVKDLVKQAITYSIYRVKANGKIYEGDYEIALDEEELVKQLMDDDHQEDLLILEKKLKGKKIAAI